MKGIKLLVLLGALLFASCNKTVEVKNIIINDYSSLDSVYTAHRSIDSNSIPPILIKSISPSIKDLSIIERKKIFIKSILVNILKNNEDILSIRDSILDLQVRLNNNRIVKQEETVWLKKISKTYRCKPDDFDGLLKKINIIPPSMAIAQSIVESGWGTSRFAIEGNSLFGEHFSNGANGDYISANNSDIKLKSFPTIYDAVRSYSVNINRHRAYRKFRDKRLEMLNNSSKLNSLELVETLGSYSELGDEYITYIKNIILKNSLLHLDDLKIEDSNTIYLVEVSK